MVNRKKTILASDAIASTRKRSTDCSRLVLVYNALDSGIGTSCQEENAGNDDNDVQDALKPATESSVLK